MPIEAPSVILDTHVWLWIIEEKPISALARAAILRASRKARVFVPAVAVLEVGLLESKRRLNLDEPIDRWVENALSAPGTRLLPLSPSIAIDSTRLPGDLHGDPFDRIMVASARHHGATLITRDQKLVDYGRTGHASVIAA